MLTSVSFFDLSKKLAIAWGKNLNDKLVPVSTGKKIRHLCKYSVVLISFHK